MVHSPLENAQARSKRDKHHVVLREGLWTATSIHIAVSKPIIDRPKINLRRRPSSTGPVNGHNSTAFGYFFAVFGVLAIYVVGTMVEHLIDQTFIIHWRT